MKAWSPSSDGSHLVTGTGMLPLRCQDDGEVVTVLQGLPSDDGAEASGLAHPT
jgi:hypothetical protein